MIALGSDHGGYDLKCQIEEYLEEKGYEYQDFGCFDRKSCDYPDFGKAAARAVADGQLIVERRCATMKVVLSFISVLNAF